MNEGILGLFYNAWANKRRTGSDNCWDKILFTLQKEDFDTKEIIDELKKMEAKENEH